MKRVMTLTFVALSWMQVLKIYSTSDNTLLGTVTVATVAKLSTAPPPLPAGLASRVDPNAIELWEVRVKTPAC